MELKTMKTQTSFSHLRGLKLAALAIGTSFVLAGCAGNPPTEQYAVTQSAVDSAVSAGGTEFAAVEMKQAQDKLKQAEIAMHETGVAINLGREDVCDHLDGYVELLPGQVWTQLVLDEVQPVLCTTPATRLR